MREGGKTGRKKRKKKIGRERDIREFREGKREGKERKEGKKEENRKREGQQS